MSRNGHTVMYNRTSDVTSREGRVSRNTVTAKAPDEPDTVTSREGRVSRNFNYVMSYVLRYSHVPRGTCE